MPSFLTSRISSGLQQDIGQSFMYGAQVAAQRVATQAAYAHEQEKARILGIAQMREAALKAEADIYKQKLDSAEKYYTEAAKYYDDQVGQYENQLLQNGQRYTPEQRQQMTQQIDNLRGEKAKVLGQRAAIFGASFTPPQNVSTGVLSKYSPQYEQKQQFDLAKAGTDARSSFLESQAKGHTYDLSGGLTTDYGEWNYSNRESTKEPKPPDFVGYFGQKLTSGQIDTFERIRQQMPAYLRYFDKPSLFAAPSTDKTGETSYPGVRLPDINGDEVNFATPGDVNTGWIAPQYEKLAGFVKRNLTPEESTLAGRVGLGFTGNTWIQDRAYLKYLATDASKDNATRGAASNLYYKLGFGNVDDAQRAPAATPDNQYRIFGIGGAVR